MTNVTAFEQSDYGNSAGTATSGPQSLKRWTAGLFLSAVLGGILGLAALALGLLTFGGFIVPSTGLYTGGTVLIGASFILFGFAAHCLDKAAEVDQKIRLEYCRQHGLDDQAVMRTAFVPVSSEKSLV